MTKEEFDKLIYGKKCISDISFDKLQIGMKFKAVAVKYEPNYYSLVYMCSPIDNDNNIVVDAEIVNKSSICAVIRIADSFGVVGARELNLHMYLVTE